MSETTHGRMNGLRSAFAGGNEQGMKYERDQAYDGKEVGWPTLCGGSPH